VRSRIDEALAGLARLLLHVFFRRVLVIDAERLPRGVPLLIVANHVNSLIDPILLLGFLGRRPRFLAKSTLWRHPVVGPFLVLAGALPVYRRQDPGANVSRNHETFARCAEHLARGGAIALFPEGRSHHSPHALPLKTGAARIALAAERQAADVRIVPVGLMYESKEEFQSNVLVRVGEAIDPGPEAARYAEAPRRAVRALTERIASGLEAVTVSYASWEEASLVERAVEIAADPQAIDDPAGLAKRAAMRRAIVHAHRRLREADPRRAERLAAALGRYERALAAHGLTDEDIAPVAAASGSRPSSRRVALLLLALPIALAGVALNWIPYRVPGWVAGRLTRTPDDHATYKVMTALFAFPFFWALEVASATYLGGPAWGLAVAVTAPPTGYAALRFLDEWRRTAALQRRSRRHVPADVAEQREALRRELRSLVPLVYEGPAKGSKIEARMEG